MNHTSSTFRRRAAQTLTGALAVALIGTAAAAPAHADSLGSDSTGSTSTGSTSTGSTSTGSTSTQPSGVSGNIAAQKAIISKYYAAHQKQLGKPLSEVQHGRETWSGGDGTSYASWQTFTGGRVVTSTVGGTHIVQPGFDKVYLARSTKYPDTSIDEALGVPTDNEHLVNGVYVQNFVDEVRDEFEVMRTNPADTGRSVMEWSKSLGGVKVYDTSGHKNMTYEAIGGTEGKLGAPTGNATAMGEGSVQAFQHGVMTEKVGVFSHTVMYGPMYDAWKASGGDSGAWGLPIKEAKTLSNGTTEQYFQHKLVRISAQGKVTASDYTRTYTDQFMTDSGENSGAEYAGFGPSMWYGGNGLMPADGGNYIFANYEDGIMVSTDKHGYVAVAEDVVWAYNDFDAAHQKRLGDPVSFTYDSKLGLTTHFEHGSLRYDEKSKKVVETK